MAFLTELGAWNWLIAALILVILEMIVPGIHFLWFGMAAILVGVIALATGISWPWQLLHLWRVGHCHGIVRSQVCNVTKYTQRRTRLKRARLLLHRAHRGC